MGDSIEGLTEVNKNDVRMQAVVEGRAPHFAGKQQVCKTRTTSLETVLFLEGNRVFNPVVCESRLDELLHNLTDNRRKAHRPIVGAVLRVTTLMNRLYEPNLLAGRKTAFP